MLSSPSPTLKRQLSFHRCPPSHCRYPFPGIYSPGCKSCADFIPAGEVARLFPCGVKKTHANDGPKLSQVPRLLEVVLL